MFDDPLSVFPPTAFSLGSQYVKSRSASTTPVEQAPTLTVQEAQTDLSVVDSMSQSVSLPGRPSLPIENLKREIITIASQAIVFGDGLPEDCRRGFCEKISQLISSRPMDEESQENDSQETSICPDVLADIANLVKKTRRDCIELAERPLKESDLVRAALDQLYEIVFKFRSNSGTDQF